MLVQLNIPRPSTHVWMFGIFIRTDRNQDVLGLRFSWFRFDPSLQAVRLPLSNVGLNRTRTQQHPIAFVRWTPQVPFLCGSVKIRPNRPIFVSIQIRSEAATGEDKLGPDSVRLIRPGEKTDQS